VLGYAVAELMQAFDLGLFAAAITCYACALGTTATGP
jgi:hypothetical protein